MYFAGVVVYVLIALTHIETECRRIIIHESYAEDRNV